MAAEAPKKDEWLDAKFWETLKKLLEIWTDCNKQCELMNQNIGKLVPVDGKCAALRQRVFMEISQHCCGPIIEAKDNVARLEKEFRTRNLPVYMIARPFDGEFGLQCKLGTKKLPYFVHYVVTLKDSFYIKELKAIVCPEKKMTDAKRIEINLARLNLAGFLVMDH